jgi:hypothetical protein
MMRLVVLGTLFVSLILCASCDTTIHPALQPASPIFVVDAFINNKSEQQVIYLTLSQPYFEDSIPPGVSGATVSIQDNQGNSFVFKEDLITKGAYVWKPNGSVFGIVGNTYTLSITSGQDHFAAATKMGRVPKIDSITFAPGDRATDGKDFYRGEFWATDPVGEGDTYWIRTTKNGVLLNKPSEINLAWDASFSPGSGLDGQTFIQPIREGINPDDTDANNKPISPYSPGDLVYVEINSLSPACFDYLTDVVVQTNRPGGFSELFARPLANVSTNITNTNPQGTVVAGFFNVASISFLQKVFIE